LQVLEQELENKKQKEKVAKIQADAKNYQD
jgi:hypothetical protein